MFAGIEEKKGRKKEADEAKKGDREEWISA